MADTPCAWAPVHDALYRSYHDQEWGVPERDSRALWEKLQLDGFQAGLAWITILRKRASMREEFEGFDPEVLAHWTEKRIAKALKNPGIIRSPQKLQALVTNAQAYLDLAAQGQPFSTYVWSFVDDRPQQSHLTNYRQAPTQTPTSERLSKDLKKRGFKYCGPTIVYAWMQAVGLVNDHEVTCPRYKQLTRHPPKQRLTTQ